MARTKGAFGLCSLVMSLFLMLAALDARADAVPQPPTGAPSAADAATAKRNFDEGLKLFGEGAFAEALAKFERSYTLGGRPSALRNVAQCHRSLRHFVEAYEAYEQLLALHEAQLGAPDKTAVKQALTELGELSGTIAVDVSQPDAEVFIDDKSVGKSPLSKPKRVVLGTHKVRVTKTGFEPFEAEVKIDPLDQKKISAQLAPEKSVGRLAVREANAREVHVFIDGEDKGSAPWEGDVAEGEHSVEAKSAKYGSEKRSVKIVRKEKLEISLDARPLLGRVRITTLPASAGIVIDDQPVGTGVFEGELPPGKHVVKVALSGQPPVTRELTVAAGETLAQEIPIVTAAGAAPPDYRGLYVRLNLQPSIPLFGMPDNSVPGQMQQENHAHLGLGGSARIGWSFDPIGLELAAAFMAEVMSRQFHLNTPRPSGSQDVNLDGTDANVFVGFGPRVTTRDDSTRFTFGIAPGLAFRRFHARYDNNSGTGIGACDAPGRPPCNAGAGGNLDLSGGYTSFGFLGDGGVLFGSTPGAKFFLGVHFWLDFPPGDIVLGPDNSGVLPAHAAPGNGIIVVDSVQFFFGPTLGVQFGR